jgi:uncharacterized membrane protein HdeD (DUF308 family)
MLMLPKFFRNISTFNASSFWSSGFWVLILALFTFPAYAQTSEFAQQLTSLSPQAILANLEKTIPNLMSMVTAIAYVMGMYFIIDGIIKLKHVGEMRTQMSHEHSMSGPIIKIAVGTLLLYLPTSVNVGMSTFWTNPNPYGYQLQDDQWAQFMNVCFLVVQFIGTIAFIRGLILLSHAGGGHGQQGAFGRGVTHVIGGILCINIYGFIQVILMTIGVKP